METKNLYSKGFIVKYPEGDKSQERKVVSFKRSSKKTHLVRDDDTLTAIANFYYGKPFLWYIIADSNDIMNPFILETGTILAIPDIKAIII